jgi:hypothetical protein
VQMPFLLRKTETRGTVNSTKVRISQGLDVPKN